MSPGFHASRAELSYTRENHAPVRAINSGSFGPLPGEPDVLTIDAREHGRSDRCHQFSTTPGTMRCAKAARNESVAASGA